MANRNIPCRSDLDGQELQIFSHREGAKNRLLGVNPGGIYPILECVKCRLTGSFFWAYFGTTGYSFFEMS